MRKTFLPDGGVRSIIHFLPLYFCSVQILFSWMPHILVHWGKKLGRHGDAGIRSTHRTINPSANHACGERAGSYRRTASMACRSVGDLRTAHRTFAGNHAGRLYNSPLAIIHPCLFSPTPVPREPPHQCCLVLVNPWKLLVLSQPIQNIHHCLKESVAFSRPWYVFSLRGKQLKYKSYISSKPRLTEDLSH